MKCQCRGSVCCCSPPTLNPTLEELRKEVDALSRKLKEAIRVDKEIPHTIPGSGNILVCKRAQGLGGKTIKAEVHFSDSTRVHRNIYCVQSFKEGWIGRAVIDNRIYAVESNGDYYRWYAVREVK